MEGSVVEESNASVANELKKSDSVEVLHERSPEINGTQNVEGVENSALESSTKTVENKEEEEWLDILGSGQLKKKVLECLHDLQ